LFLDVDSSCIVLPLCKCNSFSTCSKVHN